MPFPATDPSPAPLRPDSRILIVRLSAIGDIVFASPLIAALRRACPQGHIAWLAQPECVPLIDHHPDLDEAIACPIRHWQTLWRRGHWLGLGRCLLAMRRTLGERRFDLALDLQGLAKSGLLARLSGAPERIGLGSREGSARLMTRTFARGGERARIGSEYRYLAGALGLATDPFDMAVHYTEADAAFAKDTVAREGLSDGYAALCPFTTRPQKHWIESRWSALAGRIYRELGLIPLILGSPKDREAAERIAGAADAPLLNLAGRTGILEAAALIDRAELLVGVDTGLGHMGIAFATPTVLIFGSTRPYLETGRPNARVLYRPLPCSPCRRRPTCGGTFDCMRATGVGDVLAAARSVMGAEVQ